MIFRISIDDGHPDDLRVFSLLKKHGLTDCATFYIAPFNRQRPVMRHDDIRMIAKECEIGAHTTTHAVLTRLTPERQMDEITEGRRILQNIIGKKIRRFSYPRGWYNDETKKIVESAGFEEARTMKQGAITTDNLRDKFAIPITIHTHPNHIDGWKDLLEKAKEVDRETGKGYYSITAHGWELDKFNLWAQYEDILKAISYERKMQKLPERI